MRFPLPLLGFTAQLPLQPSVQPLDLATMSVPLVNNSFAFKTGPDVFSPQDLVELARPSTGVANSAGDLALVTHSKYSFADKTNKKSVFVVALQSTVAPIQIPLPNGGEFFWLAGQTVAHVVETDKKLELYTIDVSFAKTADTDAGRLEVVNPPTLLGSFPTTSATNFRFDSLSGHLVFSDLVHADGDIHKVKENDEAWESRGNSALVYDSTFERHWDTWVGPKTQSLFSVRLQQDPDHIWHMGTTFINLLKGTGHSSPVEPFGGTDDFDVSKGSVIYTSKAPDVPEAWHTKQNVYILGVDGNSKPKELTSGKQGAIHSPVLNSDSTKAAWLELDEDGYESDRAKIVIYDLKKNIRYTLTQKWDRSPDSLAFSKGGDFIYFTAGDQAKIKTYVLPIPPTPSQSTTTPDLAPKYYTPITITHTGAVSGLQTLYWGRLLISRSSFTSPNDVFLVEGLKQLETDIMQTDDTSSLKFAGNVFQVTHFTTDALSTKYLSSGEEIWFKGAEDKDVQGWVLKPKEWRVGDKKKWPVILLIHGGPQGAWEDQWSTRWNPNVFTQQGYFTVMLNPTGSTTFGQSFTDAIAEDWGGKPFIDLQKGWKYVLGKYPEIDADRAVAAGASWGGYAINWIQGHPEYGFNFKALVCHDGVFDSNYNGYSTDELFFFNHEWGGRPWEEKSKRLSEKFSPSNFVHKWSTPQLLIHGSKDYRLPETESIGAFHALQQLGVPTRLVIFPDENHWVLKQGNSLKWHYEVFRWLDQFVGA